MRTLSEIISANAELALERAKERARAQGRKLGWNEVAKRMARRMGSAADEAELAVEAESIARTLRDYRKNPRDRMWRVDYIEAFAASVGVHPSELLSDEIDGSGVSEASVARFLTAAVGRRLEPRQARAMVSRLNRILDKPGYFQMVERLIEGVIGATSRDEAVGAAVRVLSNAPKDFWSPKPADHKRASRKAKTPSG